MTDVRSETRRGESPTELDGVFEAIAEATRRTILDVLHDDEHQTATQITAHVAVRLDRAVSRQTVSRHLRVLRDAELVSAARAGNAYRYRLNTEPLESIVGGWLGRYLPSVSRDRPVGPAETVGAASTDRPVEGSGMHDPTSPADDTAADDTAAHDTVADDTVADDTAADDTASDDTPPAEPTPADEPTSAEVPAAAGPLSIDDRLARLHRRLRQDAEEHAERPTDGAIALPRSPRLPISSR